MSAPEIAKKRRRRQTELDGIWFRMIRREPITERDFLQVAFWAYHAMPAENVRTAMFSLFEHGTRRPETN